MGVYETEYIELRTIFVKNTSNINSICDAIGIPDTNITILKKRFNADNIILLAALFNSWYRVAINILSLWGITPNLMLAYGYYITNNKQTSRTLLNDEQEYMFIDTHRELFKEISDDMRRNYYIYKLPF